MVKKSVKQFALAIASTLVAAGIMVTLFLVATRDVRAAEAKKWNPGVAPYASSREDACKKAPRAIDGFTIMPSAVKKYFKSVVETSCKDGIEKFITPDMLPEEMWSGGAHEHVMYHMPMAQLPVLKAPDGRPYSKGSMFETAKAFQWTFVHEGKTYVLYLPWVCYNWTWMFGPVPLPEKVIEACATVKYTVKRGDKILFAILERKLLQASACWELCDGDTCTAWPAPCVAPCDWAGPKSVIPAGLEPLQTGWYIAQAEHQTLRFPLAVMKEYIALCDERDGLGESDSWIIQPSAWAGRTTIVVPYGGQPWPAWGQVDLSKWRKP